MTPRMEHLPCCFMEFKCINLDSPDILQHLGKEKEGIYKGIRPFEGCSALISYVL